MRIGTAACAAAVVALAAAGAAVSSPRGCSVNITIHNTDTAPAGGDIVEVDWKASKVKIKGGFWKKLGNTTQVVYPGDKEVETFKLDFGCGSNRRYKIVVNDQNTEQSRTVYHPSVDGWTTKQSFTVKVHI